MTMQNQNEIYREARRRVSEKAKFFKHLYIFAIVNCVLVFLSLFRGRPLMPLTVAVFWGMGLAFHYLKVFGLPGSGILSKAWEDKEIRKEMNKMQGDHPAKEELEEMELKELRKNYDDSELV